MSEGFWESKPSTVSGMMLIADPRTLELPDGSFDLVFMSWLLMYLDDGQIETLTSRLHGWTRPGGRVFVRESCFVGATGAPPSSGNPARYRSDDDYLRLLGRRFTLLRRGNLRVHEERFGNPHQHYWLFQR